MASRPWHPATTRPAVTTPWPIRSRSNSFCTTPARRPAGPRKFNLDRRCSIGGPRGSFIIPTNFDWHLLIGDDTALPAIARRLEELPAGSRAVVLVEVDGPADEIAFASAADVAVTWAHRNGAEAGTTDVLARALKTLRMPTGDYYAWVACESLTAKALRAQLIADHGANPKWMRAAGYWRRGAVAVHDNFND